jgi:ribosomal protein L9
MLHSTFRLIVRPERVCTNIFIARHVVGPQTRSLTRFPSQKVIIIKDYPEHGFVENDIVLVRRGHMRNFLYPRKIAIYATKENVKNLNERLTEDQRKILEEKRKSEKIRVAALRMKPTVLKLPLRPQSKDKSRAQAQLITPLTVADIAKNISHTFNTNISIEDIQKINGEPAVPITTSGTYEILFTTNRFGAQSTYTIVIPGREIETGGKEGPLEPDTDIDLEQVKAEDEAMVRSLEEEKEARRVAASKAKKEKLSQNRQQKLLMREALQKLKEQEGAVTDAAVADKVPEIMSQLDKEKIILKKKVRDDIKERKPRKLAAQGAALAGKKVKDSFAEELKDNK